jgi:hypothetical protein
MNELTTLALVGTGSNGRPKPTAACQVFLPEHGTDFSWQAHAKCQLARPVFVSSCHAVQSIIWLTCDATLKRGKKNKTGSSKK